MIIAPQPGTLAGQHGEMKEFFPENAVEYFVVSIAIIISRRLYVAVFGHILPRILPSMMRSINCICQRQHRLHGRTRGCGGSNRRVTSIYGLGSRRISGDLIVSLRRHGEGCVTRLLRELIDIQYSHQRYGYSACHFPCREEMWWSISGTGGDYLSSVSNFSG